MIRQLTIADEALIRQAYEWRRDSPEWFQQMLTEGGPDLSWDEYWKQSREMIEFGYFDDGLCGLISLAPDGVGRLSAHISAKRGTDPEKLALAAFTVRDWLFKHGTREIVAWVARQHRGLKRLCLLCGLQPDTVTMIRGQIRGRLITWERYSAHV